MIVGLLLVAGSSHRFGSDKLMHPLPDGRLIVEASAGCLRMATHRTIALVRPHQAALCALLLSLGVEVLEVPETDNGMGRTLASGVKATPSAEAWVVALGDMPAVEVCTVKRVVAALCDGASIAAPFHIGRRGHPIGFSRLWRESLIALDGDKGARDLLHAQDGAVTHIDVDDPGCVFDVDTPCDLERFIPPGLWKRLPSG